MNRGQQTVFNGSAMVRRGLVDNAEIRHTTEHRQPLAEIGGTVRIMIRWIEEGIGTAHLGFPEEFAFEFLPAVIVGWSGGHHRN